MIADIYVKDKLDLSILF